MSAAKKRATRRAKPRARKSAPQLAVVRRPAPKARRAAPRPTAFRQRKGASAKQLLLFELVRSGTRVHAALHGLTASAAEQPVAPAAWTIRETVLHLHAWDLEAERALEPAFRGTRPAWMAWRRAEMDRANETLLAPLRHLPWDEALRRFEMGRARLLEAIESLPEEPQGLWTKRHLLGRMLAILPDHDHHHAETIKAARDKATARPSLPSDSTQASDDHDRGQP